MANNVHISGSGKIRIGLLGCGGRGNGAMRQCLEADPGVEFVALADLFEGKTRTTRERIMADPKYAGRINIPDDNLFWGFDCHEKIAKCDLDLILMATAPGFRGRQMLAAVNAGKHIFTEKPVATDVTGCRQVMEAANIAKEKGLAIVAGTQRRHELGRIETMKRIQDGAIGELAGGQCYWYGSGIWYRLPEPGMSELEWQCHNWYHFTWLCGDQIAEQHIHNIDIMNWCFGGPPVAFTALGGRSSRDHSTQAKEVCRHFNNGSEKGWQKYNGNIWDHMFTELEYANGARVLSFSGHCKNSTKRKGEEIVGTKGRSNCNGIIEGENAWKYEGQHVHGMLREHIDLIQSIRAGKPLNEGVRIAETTLTAIGARMAAYTGRKISWKWLLNASRQDLVPPHEMMKPGPGHFNPIATGADPLV